MDIIKIGSVELTRAEAEKFCHEGKYIVACRRISLRFRSGAWKSCMNWRYNYGSEEK